MQISKIQLSKLLSPKANLDHQKRGKPAFLKLVQDFKLGKPYEPITVCLSKDGLNYFIQDGVHRAKAAQIAGRQDINAYVFRDSGPIGRTTPLSLISY